MSASKRSSGGQSKTPSLRDGGRWANQEQPITTSGPDSSSVTAESIALKAASLVGGERARTHGADKVRNHRNIAAMWNAYMAIRREPESPLSALDACHMMVLLKMARTQFGAHNSDDWLDMTGYASVCGEIAEKQDV